MTLAIFWDLDGTILTTQRAGIRAYEEALERVTGRRVSLADFPTAGLTDLEIAHRILEAHDGTQGSAPALLAAYEELLPAALDRGRVHAIPEAAAILEALRARSDARSFLLTGNTRRGAAAKLSRAGLADLFAAGGYSNPLRQRAEVAVAALREAERHLGGPVPPGRRIVIGDTPHDVACARAIDARCIAVGSGPYAFEALRATGAWRVLPRLPPPPEFFTMLGLAAAPRPA